MIATGKLKQRSFETKEGEKRTVVELEVSEIGPSLKYATAQVTKAGSRVGAGTNGSSAASYSSSSSSDAWGSQDELPPF